jgi:hypothetical protein
MPRNFLAVVPLALLGACSAQEQCLWNAHAPVYEIDQQVSQSELDLRRGYRLAPYDPKWDFIMTFCVNADDEPVKCIGPKGPAPYKREPINRRAEAAKLDELRRQQAEEYQRYQAAAEACKAL